LAGEAEEKRRWPIGSASITSGSANITVTTLVSLVGREKRAHPGVGSALEVLVGHAIAAVEHDLVHRDLQHKSRKVLRARNLRASTFGPEPGSGPPRR
jgi:hypothetical protein